MNSIHEMAPARSVSVAPAQAPVIGATTPPVQHVGNGAATVQSVQNNSVAGPTIAADDDVIEREWVDKAKQVVNNTSGDPRLQKRNVSLLQADYISKRYGKALKLPKD